MISLSFLFVYIHVCLLFSRQPLPIDLKKAINTQVEKALNSTPLFLSPGATM